MEKWYILVMAKKNWTGLLIKKILKSDRWRGFVPIGKLTCPPFATSGRFFYFLLFNMPSYYAIIPADVRYDTRICANAKLLFGEITALCNEKGFCWATNTYFSELYGVSIKTISRWVRELLNYGYIISELKYKSGTKEIESRIIRLSNPMDKNIPTPKNVQTYPQKCPDPMDKNVLDNNTVINTTINNTKEAPLKQTIKSEKPEIPLPFNSEQFKQKFLEWRQYRKEKHLAWYKPIGLEKFFVDLKELARGDEQTAIGILEQSMRKGWQGVFSLKNDYQNGAKQSTFEQAGRTIEFDKA
jgi:hypothetical protein